MNLPTFRDYRFSPTRTSTCTAQCDRLTFTSDPRQVERIPVALHAPRRRWPVLTICVLALAVVILLFGSHVALIAALGATVKGIGEFFAGIRTH